MLKVEAKSCAGSFRQVVGGNICNSVGVGGNICHIVGVGGNICQGKLSKRAVVGQATVAKGAFSGHAQRAFLANLVSASVF